MKSKSKIVITSTIILCILLGGIYYFNVKMNSLSTYAIDEYANLIQNIDNNFTFSNYEELMNNRSHMLALPLYCEDISPENGFIGRQKLFVFKSRTSGTVIMLQITYTGSDVDVWSSSFSYSPDLFNASDSVYGNFYNEKIPEVQLASNSFNYKGCSFNLLCLSDDSEKDLAASELMAFSNELIKFITK